MFVFLRRKPGLSRIRFSRHWSRRHGPLVASNPEFWRYTARYVQNHLLGADLTLCDGIAISTQRDPTYRGPGFPAERCYMEIVRPDEARFLDFAAIVRRIGRSRLLRQGRSAGGKIIVLGPRDLAARLSQHALPGTARIVVSRLDPPTGRRRHPSALHHFATVAEIWTTQSKAAMKALRGRLPASSLVSEVREIEVPRP